MTESVSAQAFAPPATLDRLQRAALGVGAAGALLSLVGLATNPEQFYRSYLTAYIYLIAFPLGCLALMMIHHLSGGAWGLMIRRPLEAAASTIPVMALLFVPILVGLGSIYEWSHEDAVAASTIIQHKAPYLNSGFFVVRAVLYFAIWSVGALLLVRWSTEQERAGTPGLDRKCRFVSGPGILIYGLTITFASVDWVMSLDPEWYSTIFGLLFMVSQGLSALAFIIVVMTRLGREAPMAGVLTAKNFHDLGKLTLAFVMLWAYLSFSQWLIIWSANLPEEITWYIRRLEGGWGVISLVLVIGHFALPFALLLSRDRKKQMSRLVKVALLVLVVRYVDAYWLTAPQFHAESLAPHWLDAATLLGLAGLWLYVFLWRLRGRALLPVGDPYLREALADGH